jgi:predicted O-linked N-acetylglucosamine transferase (SPINDLY family)/glycosyltransferase involved in cell wall biosynthesis
VRLAFVDFHPAAYTCDTPYEEPLGGSQSAVAYLTAALARRGHEVTVVNAVPAPVVSAAVDYVPKGRLTGPFLNQFDVVIVVSVAIGGSLRALGITRPMFLWCHHDVDQPAVRNLLDADERTAWSGFAMVSKWQADRYATTAGVLPASQRVLGNAVSPAFLDLPRTPAWYERGDAPALYYASTPFRGLNVLVDAMPLLSKAIPGIHLQVFSSMRIYGVPSNADEYAWLYDKCKATAGVTYRGALSQKSLAMAVAAADVLAYPCTFPETSCISVMEAMAAGSMVVANRLGALEETTAGYASLMEHPAGSVLAADAYAGFLIERLKEAAAQPGAEAARSAAQRQFVVDNYTWEKRAGEWEQWLSDISSARMQPKVAAPVTAQSAKAAGSELKGAGAFDAAIALYRRSMEIDPDNLPALYNLGLVYHETGSLAEAETCFRRIVAADASDTDSLIHLGSILCKQSRHAEGAETFRRALRLAPSDARLWLLLASACRQLGDARGAVDALGRMLELQPDSAEARIEMAGILMDEGRIDDAMAQCENAIKHAPGNAMCHNALGCALAQANRFSEAAVNLRTAIALQRDFADAHHNLGNALSVLGERAEALLCFQEAFRLRPGDAGVAESLLFELQKACEWSRFEELAAVRRRDALDSNPQPVNPFSFLSIPSTRIEQLRCATTFAQKRLQAGEPGKLRASPGRSPGNRLRIGYLSADFHEHATAYLMAELFELHDRKRFEVLAYSYGPEEASPMRARLRRAFDRFVDIRTLPHDAAAGAIDADGVDILVDLKGYTLGARPEIAALRPAPIQVNYLGYPGTMGAGFIDYLIADRFIIPQSHAPDYSEALVLLPGCYQVNDRKRPVAATPGRSELGLPEHGFVFCCFNNAYKILPDIFSVWMRLLRAVPGSTLWLLESNPAASGNLRSEARARGVDPERLVFASALPLDRHLGRMAAADLFLDTLPYNAHTTASDALWAGLPVLTVPGETFASRVCGSLLSAVGLPELIAGSLEDYEALAVKFGREPSRLAELRTRLSRNRDTAALFDTPGFARALEAAYEKMRETRLSGLKPRTIAL